MDEKSCLFILTPEKIRPFSFKTIISEDQADKPAANAFRHVPAKTPEADMKLRTPLFTLKVPQHYRLMGYQPLSAYEAAASYISPELYRPLRTGAHDELFPVVTCASVDLSEDEEEKNPQKDDRADLDLNPTLSFCAPETLLKPPSAHPLRIFNPAPHVYAFKAAPLYLECDLDFHLCPLPRYTITNASVRGVDKTTQKKVLDRQDIIKGIMTWKKFPSVALNTLSNISTPKFDCVPHMSDMLPMEAPPVLQNLPDSIRDEIQSGVSESSELRLTPEMVEAEFSLSERSSATSVKQEPEEGNGPTTPAARPTSAETTTRDTYEQLPESTHIRLRTRVLNRFKDFKSTGR